MIHGGTVQFIIYIYNLLYYYKIFIIILKIVCYLVAPTGFNGNCNVLLSIIKVFKPELKVIFA